MSTFTGTHGGVLVVAHDEDGVYVRAPYKTAHLSPDCARRLAAELLALADEGDAWMTAAMEQYR